MQTSNLTGAALDWAVAKASGTPIYRSKNGGWMTADYGQFNHRHGAPWYKPSTNWAQGGVIIESEGMGVWMYQWNEQGDPEVGWYAETKDGDHVKTGTTPLIAAMRCYVASKLGDEVDLPPNL